MLDEHGMLENQGTRAGEEERQSEEWEAVLADVTVEARRADILFSPSIMELLMAEYGERYANYLADSSYDSTERLAQLKRIKEVAARKLGGRLRDCFLSFVIAGKSIRQIALDLGIAPDSVRRNIERAMKELLPVFENRIGSLFPSDRWDLYRTVVLPLDTEEERKAFQRFINEHTVHHLSYSSARDAREVLLVWSPLPALTRQSAPKASARTDFVDAMIQREEALKQKPKTLH